jgi:uncharacterized protein with HEPN domain
MNKDELRAPDYVGHLKEACDRILSYTAGLSYESFLQNQMVQDAVLRNIAILGEATKRLLECWPDATTAHPEIPWIDIYGMRNRITHAYSLVNLEVVWNVVEVHIPTLQVQLLEVLQTLQRDGPTRNFY